MVNEKTSYEIEELIKLDIDINRDVIFENLKNDNCDDFMKIFSIINLDEIKTLNEAHLLINHLTNHSNPLREATALKIEELYFKNSFNFFDEEIKNQFLKALIDINPNICRVICNIISSDKNIQENLEEDIIMQIEDLIQKIKIYQNESKDFFDNKIRNQKNHAKNKLLFSLYWLLEAFSFCVSEKYNSRVLEILAFTIKFSDYTIREKTAKILANTRNCPLEMLQIAKADQNFYVKNQVYDKINFED